MRRITALFRVTQPAKIIAVMRSHSPFGRAMIEEIRRNAEECIPSVHVEIMSPVQDENVNQQILCLKEAMAERPDILLLMPASFGEHLIGDVVKVIRIGIPVVTIDRQLSKTEFIREGVIPPVHIASDFRSGGCLAAETMMKKLRGEGNVAVISGPKHSEVSQMRKLAFIDEIVEHSPSLRIVCCRSTGWGEDEGAVLMAEFLAEGIRIDGVFCCNDSLAFGALKAIRELQPANDITIMGYDGVPAMREAILKGEVYATIDVDIRSQARTAIVEAAKILGGRDRYFRSHPGQILVRPRVLTRAIALRNSHR